SPGLTWPCDDRPRAEGLCVADSNVYSGRGSGATSMSLLVRVKLREPRAWEQLVLLYTPLVYEWCRANGLEEFDAADVGQEVFLAVARTIGDFRLEQSAGTFRGWLRTITLNKVRD